jgi:hypothetical protein
VPLPGILEIGEMDAIYKKIFKSRAKAEAEARAQVKGKEKTAY